MKSLEEFIKNKKILEIGGPSKLLNYIYNSVESIEFLNHKDSMEVHETFGYPEKTTAKYFGDATEFNLFESNNLFEKYEVIITSHTLEHIANPIFALKIWKKCLVHNGTIINIVPNKKFCWDKCRDDTTNEHLLNDYLNNIDEMDMTHLHESSCMPRPNYYEDVGPYNRTRVIHHHVFSEDNLKFIHEYCGFLTKKFYIDDEDQLQMIYIGINE